MFNSLYRCSRTIARHENAPLAESRRCYLEHLAAQGAAIHTIRAAAGVIYRATILMRLDESSPVERRDVERAAKHWAHRWYRNASSRGPDQTDKEFRQTTCNWLRLAGRLRESDRPPLPHQQEIRTGPCQLVSRHLTKACSRHAALQANHAGSQSGGFATMVRMVSIAQVITRFSPRWSKTCECRSATLRTLGS